MTQTEKITIIITAISALATIAAAIIYYYTLNELKKQTKNTYKPHLFVGDIEFNVIGTKKGEIVFPTKWSENFQEFGAFEIFDPKKFSLNKFSLKTYNIGFGTATNISILFQYDIEAFVNEINNLGNNITTELSTKLKIDNNFISFTCDNHDMPYSKRAISKIIGMNQYLSNILPIHIAGEHSPINLPYHFLELLNLYVFTFMSIENEKEKNISFNIPLISMLISYSDIAKNQFSKKYTLEIELSTMSAGQYNGKIKMKEITT